jgi:putative transposase
MHVAEKLFRSLVDNYARDPVYTEGSTWYPEACNVIGLKHKPCSLISSCVISDTILLFIR